MNYLKFFAAVAAAMFVCAGAFAQENGNRDANGKIVRGPYETNSFGSNWFVSVGGGVDLVLDGVLAGSTFDGGLTPTLDVNFGKWFTPSVGARFGYEGWAYKAAGNKVGNHLFHGDLMWNLSNAIGGYKQTRVYNFIPYAQAGVFASKAYGREFELGAGLLNNFRINDHLAINLDIRYSHLKGEQFGCDGEAGLLSAAVGLTWNIGKSTWKRASSSCSSADNNALESLRAVNEALKNANAALAAEKKALAGKNEELAAANDELGSKNKELLDELAALKDIPAVAQFVDRPVVLYFELGSSSLNSTELHRLDDYVKGQAADAKYTLIGSADLATGTREINEALCQSRVEYVAAHLRELGVKSENITIANSVLADIPEHPEFGRSVTIGVTR